jgi:hypothetical protein
MPQSLPKPLMLIWFSQQIQGAIYNPMVKIIIIKIKNSNFGQGATPNPKTITRDTKEKKTLKFPWKNCIGDHLTHKCPQMEEIH